MAKDKNPVEINITSKADTDGIDKAKDALNETTEATKKLTAAEEDRARRKREYDERMAAKRANGTNVATFPGEEANPMADGSQLGSVNAVTDAVQTQRKSWEELSEVQEDAALIEQRLADVEEARRIGRARDIEDIKREADETVKAQQAMQTGLALKATAIAGVATAWATLTGEVRKQIDALKEISPEAAKQFAAYEAGLSALENPFRAAILPTIRETEEEMNLLRQAIQNAATAEANYQAAVKARAEEAERASTAWIDGVLKRELQLIEDGTRAYERRQRQLAALRAEMEAVARLNDAQRIAGGEDPSVVNAQAAARQSGQEQAAIQEKAAKAKFDLDQANDTIQSLTEAIGGAASQKQREELEAKREQLIRERDDLQAEFDTVLQEQASADAVAQAKFEEQVIAATKDREKAAADAAKNIVSLVEGSGKELADINKKGIDRLKKITADGRITESEMSQYFEGVQQSQAGLLLQTEIQNAINDENKAAIAALNQVAGGLKKEMEKIRQQSETLLPSR